MQGSSYTVQQLTHTEGAKKTIFAVNFLLSEQAVFALFRLRVKNPAGTQALFATAEREWVKKGVGCGDAVLAALYAIRAQRKRDRRAAYFSGRQQEIIASAPALIERDCDRIAARVLPLPAAIGFGGVVCDTGAAQKRPPRGIFLRAAAGDYRARAGTDRAGL